MLNLFRRRRRVLERLTVFGPYRGPTGYDRHVRAFVRELERQGVGVCLVELAGWSPARLPETMLDPRFAEPTGRGAAPVLLQFCMPHQLLPWRGGRTANFTMFEANRVPAAWIQQQRPVDLVIVPTESSRRAWVASGMPEDRLRLCPLGVDAAAFGGQREARETPLRRYATRFLNVAAYGPRKNLDGLLRVWKRATRSGDSAALLLKPGCYTAESQAEFGRLLQGLDRAAPVFVLDELLPDEAMPALYAAATHYISLSHGEGWDQPMMEAAASGLKLIAPRHSAYTAYLDDSIASLIPSVECPVAWSGDAATAALFENASWWEPDEEAAVEAVRAAIDGRDPHGAPARERVLSEFTWERATRRLLEILAELG